jgi:di/tricarboxylate transporter
MGWEAWFTLAMVALVVFELARERVPPDVLIIGVVTLLLLVGILTPEQALAGMSNDGMIIVGVMYIIVAGLRDTGGMEWIAGLLLGRPKTNSRAQARLMIPVATISAFIANTPLVAMFIPPVISWTKRNNLAPSKLMIPLSYAAILGGVCSLIGTSTNLVVHGLMLREDMEGLGMFETAWVGIPCAVAGIAFVLIFSRWLLPDRRPAISQLSDTRQYTVEMMVQTSSPLVGRTIEAAGLRHLPGMFLAEIEREGEILAAVGPEEKLRGGDRLVFIGMPESVVDLQKVRGLEPATNQVFKLDSHRADRLLIEVVVSNSCPVVNRTIREGRFRNLYNAVIIAVARDGERIKGKIGDIVLRPGDTLLLEAHPSFIDQQRNSRDFLLISPLADSAPLRHEKAPVALAILLGVVVVASFEWLSMLKAALLGAGLMLLTRCCSAREARKTVDWQILLVIAGSFALGTALEETGATKFIATNLIALAGGHPWMTLALVSAATVIFTEIASNNASAVLVFPIAMAASQDLGVEFRPFAIAILIAASAGFASPIGYQTHLMVYGPGGYRFSDFFRLGIPMDLIVWGLSVLLIPLFWPLRPVSPGRADDPPAAAATARPVPGSALSPPEETAGPAGPRPGGTSDRGAPRPINRRPARDPLGAAPDSGQAPQSPGGGRKRGRSTFS